VGAVIAADYKWNLYGLDDDHEYNEAIKGCHLRAAHRMINTCISNGGLYIKMGQALSTMNHVLPREFYMTLRALQTREFRHTNRNQKIPFDN
jgi:aarF domain-containing kinase